MLHKERIKAVHTRDFTQLRAARMRKTLLLLCGLYCVLARECAVLQYTRAVGETGRGDGCPPSPTCAWGLLLYAQGVTHRWQRRWGQKWENAVVGTAACTVAVQCYHT